MKRIQKLIAGLLAVIMLSQTAVYATDLTTPRMKKEVFSYPKQVEYEKETSNEQDIIVRNPETATQSNIRFEEKEQAYEAKTATFHVVVPKIIEKQGVTITKGKSDLEILPKEGVYQLSVCNANSVLFNEIAEGKDAQYTVDETGLYQTVIYRKQTEIAPITYELNASNATIKQEKDLILVYQGDEILFTIHAPVVTDANGVKQPLQYELKKGLFETKLILTVDEAWINQPERAYPIHFQTYAYHKKSKRWHNKLYL